MSRELWELEKGIKITSENSDSGVSILFGAGAPGGDTGPQDAAEKGSIYMNQTNGFVYNKHTAGTGADKWDIHPQLSSAYAAATGDPAAADTFEEALAKVDGNIDQLLLAVGIAQGAGDMGVFTGNILTDNSDIKSLLQEISDYIESVVDEQDSADGVTTETVIDDELVDNVKAVIYHLSISLFDDETQSREMIIAASHNGTLDGVTDADEIDDTVYAKRSHGSSFNYTLSMGLSGTGAAQKMEIRVASTETNGVNVRCQKVSQVNC